MDELMQLAVDREFLRKVADKEHDLPDDIDPFAFAKALLPNLASSDGELRDDFTSMILASDILAQNKLTPQQTEELLNIVIDEEHLFHNIGEKNTDTVFMRSFSSLIVAAILYNELRQPSFHPWVIQKVKLALFRYAREEKDWRGHIEGKGWAHAMAHLADALDECAQHPSMTTQDRQDFLQLIGQLASIAEPLYHEEDMRLATVAFHIILGKQVSDEFIENWLNECAVPRKPDVDAWHRLTNSKNFLRSLYFLCFWDSVAPSITALIVNHLKKQDEVYLETGEIEA